MIRTLINHLRARAAAPLLKAQRDEHWREVAKYSERIHELAVELKASEADRDQHKAMREHHEAEAEALTVDLNDATNLVRYYKTQAEPKPRKKPTAEERFEALKRDMARMHKTEGGVCSEIRAVLGGALEPLTSLEIARGLRARQGYEGHTESDRKIVSDYARCGYLTVTKVKGVVRYSLPEVPLSNCDTCAHDFLTGDKMRGCGAEWTAGLGGWITENTVGYGPPKPGSTGCPGYARKAAP